MPECTPEERALLDLLGKSFRAGMECGSDKWPPFVWFTTESSVEEVRGVLQTWNESRPPKFVHEDIFDQVATLRGGLGVRHETFSNVNECDIKQG